MPRQGYKQSSAHKVKLDPARTTNPASKQRCTEARVRAIAAYMGDCARQHGFPDVDSYRNTRRLYSAYRQARKGRGLGFLSFENYLLAQQVRKARTLTGLRLLVPDDATRLLIIACAAKRPVKDFANAKL